MNSKLEKLESWLNFIIENQLQLKVENADIGFPEWNKGYLEALEDMKRELNKAMSICKCDDKYHHRGAVCL